MEKRNTYFLRLFRMALKSRNETGNWLRICVSFHVKRTRRALGMFLFPFMKRNNEIRGAPFKIPPISPPNAGKYRHFRPRLYRTVFCFANYSDRTLTPELMAVNPESLCRTSKVATISHGPSVRHSHARWASGEGTDS